jgi:putative cardiolipin synthase
MLAKLNTTLFLVFMMLFSGANAQTPEWLHVQKHNYPFYVVDKSNNNEIQLLNNGTGALQKRMELVQKAKKTLELEYYIFSIDSAGVYLLQELIEAAKRGVKVKILVDSFQVLEIDKNVAHVLKRYGIEVKHYNVVPLIKLSSVNFRNHKKMLVMDGKEAIVGGRNIGNDYFDFSAEYNFLDRDVWIKGPIVKAIEDNFYTYWNHKISKTPKKLPKKLNENLQKVIKSIEVALTENENNRYYKKKLKRIGNKILASEAKGFCPELSFVTDKPGGSFKDRIKFKTYKKEYRILKDVISEEIVNTEKELYLSSTYMIHNKVNSRKLLKHLLEKKIDIKFFTNSLNATDALHVATSLYRNVFKWARYGIKAIVHNGKYFKEHELVNTKAADAKWGTHSKTIVFDNKSFMIGSYNIDNRSAFYNTEVAIFCKGNQKLTDALVDDMDLRANEVGYEIIDENTAIDSNGKEVDPYANASLKQKYLLKLLKGIIHAIEFIL